MRLIEEGSLLFLLLLLLLLGAARGETPARRKATPREGAVAQPADARGLADPLAVTAADLVEGGREYAAATARRRFGGPVLGYVSGVGWGVVGAGGTGW